MEDISAKALPHLKEDADPDSIEDDWLVNFFDKSRIVSDQEMQKLWSHVLAGEANVPGTYSKRAVNLLSGLDKAEALLFTKLCGFIVFIGEPTPLVFDESAQIYNRHGIDFSSLSHLDSIGLIQYGGLTGFLRKNMPKKVTAWYYQRPIILQLPKDIENDFDIGKVLLTRIWEGTRTDKRKQACRGIPGVCEGPMETIPAGAGDARTGNMRQACQWPEVCIFQWPLTRCAGGDSCPVPDGVIRRGKLKAPRVLI